LISLGIPIKLVTPQDVYQSLAKTDKTRQKRYLALFEQTLSDYTLEAIRESVNRSWVLGSTKFENHAIYWQFTFYKPKDKWLVNGVQFLDSLDILYETVK